MSCASKQSQRNILLSVIEEIGGPSCGVTVLASKDPREEVVMQEVGRRGKRGSDGITVVGLVLIPTLAEPACRTIRRAGHFPAWKNRNPRVLQSIL